MKIAQAPWSSSYDGHGGICLDDADGRQIGFVSARPEQEAHAALLKEAPSLLSVALLIDAHYSASLDFKPPYVKAARDILARLAGAIPGAVETPLHERIAALEPERGNPGQWVIEQHWPERASYPQWFVRRRIGKEYEYALNDKRRKKRFRVEQRAQQDADARNKT